MNSTKHLTKWEIPIFLLLSTGYFYFHAYKSLGAYFLIDDFDHIYWSYARPYWEFFLDIIDPRTMFTESTYRPIPYLTYKIFHSFFELDAFYYHLFARSLHLINCVIVYLIIREFVSGRIAATVGGLFFTYRLTVNYMHWEFSMIFEILCAFFMFLSIIFYIRSIKCPGSTSRNVMILVSILFFLLAIRSKERAFVIPVLLTLYEIILFNASNELNTWKRIFKRQFGFYLIAAIYCIPRILAGLSVSKDDPYAMILSGEVLLEGIRFFAFQNNPSFGALAIIFFITTLIVLVLLSKSKILIFSLIYVFLCFLPVIFLAHHRLEAYWYIPQFGVALFVSSLIQSIQNKFSRKITTGRYFVISIATIILIVNSVAYSDQRGYEEAWYLEQGAEYKSFVQQIQSLSLSPPSGSLMIFSDSPSPMDSGILHSLIGILYPGRSIDVELTNSRSIKREEDPVQVIHISYKNRRVSLSNASMKLKPQN